MQPKSFLRITAVAVMLFSVICVHAQDQQKDYKNVVRYNVSNALLFGFDRYVILGYERVINDNQSVSINFGRASLPKLVSFSTDSFQLNKDAKNNGYNFSIDYRFYLSKENKYAPPHGIYIGPFYSFNHFDRESDWTLDRPSGDNQFVSTSSKFNIHTVGFELGYQFVFWKRWTLDMILVGPGFADYNLKTDIENNLSEENKQQLQNAVEQLLTQKFPGMNYVFSDKHFDANGTISTWSVGYRYLINVGFRF